VLATRPLCPAPITITSTALILAPRLWRISALMPDQILQRRTWILLLVVAAVPSVLALVQLGRIHPDELYQTLEPAYFRAHGYGLLAWEWQAGIRNWAVPLPFPGQKTVPVGAEI